MDIEIEMDTDFEALLEYRNKAREWDKTEIGQLFAKYENSRITYWVKDGDDRVSKEQLRELNKACRMAKREFLIALRGF